MKRTSRLVSALVLCGGTFASGPVVPAFPATPVATVEVEAMPAAARIAADSTASGGLSVALSGKGSLAATVTAPSPVTGVTVRAKGDQCLGAPVLAVRLDGTTVATFTVTSTSWANYSAAAPLPAGAHALTLAYRNG